MSFMPKYGVNCGERLVAEIKKQFTFFVHKYTIEHLGWEIEGGLWDHDYCITKDGRKIVSISKEWMTWGDTYEIDIADPADEIVAMAVVLAIDCVAEARN